MTPDFSLLILLATGIVAGLCLLSAKLGHVLGKAGRPISLDPVEPVPARPQVVINVPADYKPLEPLMTDGKPALVGPRALLFWTVYDRAIKAFTIDGTYSLDTDQEYEACETAKAAVQQVYGDTFDT